jgi:dTDP-4-dehydrorhamnose 3,5-epimerase
MEIEETSIRGLKIIYLDKFSDLRGDFLKVFNEEIFKKNDLDITYKENYFSISNKNVIRGMHYQIPPYQHTKLVCLNYGAILDVVLDIRKESATYGQHFSVKITLERPAAIYIPVGCAHGFLSLEENTIVSYLQTSVYNSDCDCGIHYNSFGMDWNVKEPIISDRDNAFISLKEFETIF